MSSSRLLACLLAILTVLAIAPSRPAQAQGVTFGQDASSDSDAEEADLIYLNRPIMTFRATIGTTEPRERAARAHRRLIELESEYLQRPIELSPIELAGQRGFVISIAGRILFGVAPGDVDPEQISNVEILAQDAKSKLAEALAARVEQKRLPVIVRGIVLTGIGFIHRRDMAHLAA
jgi:hypothetical protein